MAYSSDVSVDVPNTYDRVAVCDLEGTLTVSDLSWVALGEAHGVSRDRCGDLYDQFTAGALTQEAYREQVVDLWQDHDKPPTQERLQTVMDRHLDIHPDAPAFVDALQEAGYYTILASGALDRYSEQAADMLGVHTDISTIWAVYGDDGILERFDWSPYKSNKVALIEDIQEKADVAEVVAIGNGANDIGMVTAADRGYMVPTADLDYDTLDDIVVGSLDAVREHVLEVDGHE